MAHSDDDGLVCPPKIAPIQVVIVPIFDNDKDRMVVLDVCAKLNRELVAGGYRVKLDNRETVSAGFKFNEWEVKGVPLRIEVGPKDVAAKSAVLARRDMPGGKGKESVGFDGVKDRVKDLLDEIQSNLLARAKEFQQQHLKEIKDYEGFKKEIEGNFVMGYWAGDTTDEDKIQAETKATIRVIPFDQPKEPGVCFYTGKPASKVAIFAKSY